MTRGQHDGYAVDRQRIHEDLRDLVELGPRFTGSPAEREARAFVRGRLDRLGLEVTEFPYTFPGWELRSRPTLQVLAPEALDLDALAFIYCAGTDGKPVEGVLAPVGTHRVIGCFDWTKYAIVDDGRTVAFVSARPDGPAIPQPLDAESVVLPHFIVGRDVLDRFDAWLAEGRKVSVRGTIDAAYGYRGEAADVIARYRPEQPSPFRLVLCGHLDSMYECPGANDNGGGVVALLELARAIAAEPPPFAVDLIWFTGEESDLAGSRALVDSLDDADLAQIRLLINLDGIAETADQLHVWSSSEALESQLRDSIERHVMRPEWNPNVHYTFPPKLGSDHIPYAVRGVPVVMMTGFEMCRYHSPEDVFYPELATNVAGVVRLVWEMLGAVDTSAEAPQIFHGQSVPMTVGR